MYKPLFLLLAMVRKNLRKNRVKALILKRFWYYFLLWNMEIYHWQRCYRDKKPGNFYSMPAGLKDSTGRLYPFFNISHFHNMLAKGRQGNSVIRTLCNKFAQPNPVWKGF